MITSHIENIEYITHIGLVKAYGDKDPGQLWLLTASSHSAIVWINDALSSVRSSDIRLSAS